LKRTIRIHSALITTAHVYVTKICLYSSPEVRHYVTRLTAAVSVIDYRKKNMFLVIAK